MSNPFPPPPPQQPPFPLPPPQKQGMSGCLKAFLIVAAVLLVLGGGCVAVGMWWWSNNGDQVQAVMLEGERAGRAQDEQGCVTLARGRAGNALDIGGMVRNGMFLRGCLNAARETPGFCQGVPPESEFRESAAWRARQCPNGDQSCQLIMQTVQQYCSRERPGRGFGNGPAAAPAPGQDSAAAAAPGARTDTATGSF